MTDIDPVLIVKQVLEFYGHTDVNYQTLEARALSAPEYIFLEQVGGVVVHGNSVARATLQIVLYAVESPADNRESLRRHSLVGNQLADAQGKKFPLGGIHRVINRLSPQRQDIPGIPYGVGRTVSQFDFVLRTSEGWA